MLDKNYTKIKQLLQEKDLLLRIHQDNCSCAAKLRKRHRFLTYYALLKPNCVVCTMRGTVRRLMRILSTPTDMIQKGFLNPENDLRTQIIGITLSLLNLPAQISKEAMARLPQVPTNHSLDVLPTNNEEQKAVQQLSSGKAPGSDSLSTEIHKASGHSSVN